MITQTAVFQSPGFLPYRNQAIEEYLLDRVLPGQVILYLWQNRRTVVIGHHQLAMRECDCAALEADGGYLARRLSGGGAVYHDGGNLNFTFLLHHEDYDLSRQLGVIASALRALGIAAEISGRNDLVTADGRKFSGNAFFRRGDRRYHHGTIMVDVDGAALARYLRPSAAKLRAKGVDSVRSRVVNLRELLPELTVERLAAELIAAFSRTYGSSPQVLTEEYFDPEILDPLTQRYTNPLWRLGHPPTSPPFFSHRFPWGEFELYLEYQDTRIHSVQIWSDAMDSAFIGELTTELQAACAGGQTPAKVLQALHQTVTDRERAAMLTDILALIGGKPHEL